MDVYGLFVFMGTALQYLAHLWRPPGQLYQDDSSSSSDDDDHEPHDRDDRDDRDDDGSESGSDEDAAYNALLKKDDERVYGVPASYRWADPEYGIELASRSRVVLVPSPRPTPPAVQKPLV